MSDEEYQQKVKQWLGWFQKGYSPDTPINMAHLREGANFRLHVIKIAINLIVGEGFQENFNTFAQMFD